MHGFGVQSMHQMGKRATLRHDNLFTEEVYTYDTSNESLVHLSENRSVFPACTARVMGQGMPCDTFASGNDAND